MTPLRVVFISVYLVCGMQGCLGKCSHQTTCTTKACNEIVNRMQSLMDATVSPCDQFEQYACGGYKKKHANTTWAEYFFWDMIEMSKIRVKEILKRPIQIGVDKGYVRKAKTFFQSCMDTDAIEARGMVDYPTYWRNDWPTLNPNWDRNSFNLQQVFNRYAHRNVLVDVIMNVTLWYDRQTFKIRPNRWLPKGSSSKSEKQKRYVKFYTDTAVALGADRTVAKRDAKRVVQLMKMVTKIRDSKDPGKVLFITLRQMNKDYPYIDWVELATALSGSATGAVAPDNKMHIVNPGYFKGLENVLRKADNRTLQNLFGFKYVYDLLPYSTQKMKDIRRNFTNSTQKENRTQLCSALAIEFYEFAILKIEAKRILTKKSKKFLGEMVANVKAEQIDTVRNQTWMTKYTKDGLLMKLNAISAAMGVPDRNFDEDSVEKLYRPFKASHTKFLKSYIQNRDQFNAFNFAQFNKDARDFNFRQYNYLYPIAYIAYYPNEFTIPMGLLQNPYFDEEFPSYINYANIGSAIGHELAHMFGGLGRLFNYKGVMGSFWNETDVEYYNKKSKCYIRQLSEYKHGQLNETVNGVKSYEECLDDHSGLFLAYRAYKKYAAHHPEEKPLPRMNMTKDQLFFMSYAQGMCFVGSDEQWLGNVNGTYANGNLRILNAIKNTEEFAKAFNCKKGDYMVPDERCGLWE